MGQWQRLLFPIGGMMGIGGDSLSPLPFIFKINGNSHWWIDGDWRGFTAPYHLL